MFSSKSTMQRCRPKHWRKIGPGEDCIEKFVMKFCTEKLPKVQSTVSNSSWKRTVKHFCQEHRQKSAIRKVQKRNARQKVIVPKCYPKDKYISFSIRNFIEMIFDKFRTRVLTKTPSKKCKKKYTKEMLVEKLSYRNATQNTVLDRYRKEGLSKSSSKSTNHNYCPKQR